jgi:hypothetical protein
MDGSTILNELNRKMSPSRKVMLREFEFSASNNSRNRCDEVGVTLMGVISGNVQNELWLPGAVGSGFYLGFFFFEMESAFSRRR